MFPDRRYLRIAVMASASLHLGLVGFVVSLPRDALAPGLLDTHVAGPAVVAWSTVEAELAVTAPPPPQDPETPPPGPLQVEPEQVSTATGQRPMASTPPRTLPREIVERIRRDHSESVDPRIQQAAAREPVPAPPSLLGGGRPMHGSLASGQTIVYVLDISGSMGQSGKLDRARRALLATLREQPEDVRFQVIVYAGFARRLLPDAGCVMATVANVERTAQALLAIEPVGRSAHVDALRLAAQANPEFVLVLTDAEDLPAGAIREMTSRLARPAVVTIAIVKGDTIETPRLVTSN